MTDDLPAVATSEVNQLKEFQQGYHRWSDKETDDWRKEREEEQLATAPPIESPFYRKKTKVIAAPIYNQMMSSTQSDDNSYVYRSQMNFDRLLSVSVRQQLPRTRVKPEHEGNVEIRWCENLLNNIILSATVKYGTIYSQTITRQVLDFHRHALVKSSYKLYDHNLGNRKELTSWSAELPEVDDLTVELPFSFCDDLDDISKALPLNILRASGIEVTFSVVPMLTLSKLLLIRRKEGDEWKQLKPTNEMIKEFLICERLTEPTPGNFEFIKVKKLNVPELSGEYAKLSPAVLQDDKGPCELDMIEYLIEKIPIASDQPITHPVKTRSTVKSTIIMAENQLSVLFNDYSNYTTHVDRREGRWPISEYQLTFDENDRIERTHAVVESRRNGQRYYRIHDPDEKGYLIINYSYHPRTSLPDTTYSYDQEQKSELKLYFTPMREKISYNLYILHRVMKRLTLQVDPKYPMHIES